MHCTVVHMSGSKKGQIETFEGDRITCGRNPTNTLQFDMGKDLDVSSDHAALFTGDDGKLQVVDLGSKNGTFLNGTKIGANSPVPVEPGSTIEFGKNGPKVKLDYVPGPKKAGATRVMLAQVQQDLEAQKAKAASASTKMIVGIIVVLVLAVGGGLGFFFYSKSAKAKEAAEAAIAAAEKQVKKAGDHQAEEFAKEVYAEAKKKLDEAKAALATDKAAAEKLGKEATELGERADDLALLGRQEAQRAADRKKFEDDLAAERKRQEEERARIAKEQEEKIAALKAETDAAGAEDKARLQAQLDALLGEKKAREDKEKRIQALFASSKGKAVYIIARSYYEPQGNKDPGQRKIITEASGAGFVVADGWIVTAKHVVQPYKYDPASIAKHRRYINEKKLTPIDYVEVWGMKDGTFQELGKFSTADKTLDVVPTADELGDEQEATIEWELRRVTDKVKPHKQYVNDIALVRLKDASAAGVLLAASGALKSGSDVIGLGTSRATGKVEALYTGGAVAKVSPEFVQVTRANVSAAFHGGPVIDIGTGQIVGMTVGGGLEELYYVPIEAITAHAKGK